MNLNKKLVNTAITAIASGIILTGCTFFIDRGKSSMNAMNEGRVSYTEMLFREGNLRADNCYDLLIEEERRGKDGRYFLLSSELIKEPLGRDIKMLKGQPIILLRSQGIVNRSFHLQPVRDGERERVYKVRIPNEDDSLSLDRAEMKIYYDGKYYPLERR